MTYIKKSRSKAGRTTLYERHSSGSTPKVRSGLNFKLNTDVGQHILKNPGIADEIVKKANIRDTDTVLEIGPGTGNITVRLLKKARKVIVVELDPRMAAEVTKRVQGTMDQAKLEVMVGDVIKLPELPPHNVLVSNTPYVISSPLVFKILGMQTPPRAAVFMFQREFALRLIAKPGDKLYSRLSVNTQFWAKAQHIMKVGKNNFKPPPKVESDVVRIEPNKAGRHVAFQELDGLLRICFNRKNKTLRAAWLNKDVLAICEKNYRTWCALNHVPVDTSPVERGDDNDDADDAGSDVDMGDGEEEPDKDDDTPVYFIEVAAVNNKAEQAKTPSRRLKTQVAELVREKVRRVLEKTGLAGKRARLLHENDFLKMLLGFHEEGIHFA